MWLCSSPVTRKKGIKHSIPSKLMCGVQCFNSCNFVYFANIIHYQLSLSLFISLCLCLSVFFCLCLSVYLSVCLSVSVCLSLLSVEGQGFGLHIAEGYAQTSKGLEMKGVFVKEIVPGSPAESCGRS